MNKFILLFILLGACTTTIPADMHPQIITPPPLTDLQERSIYNITKIKIDVQQFDFLPNEIIVPKGEKVRLVLTARDVNHTFTLPEFGIDEELDEDDV